MPDPSLLVPMHLTALLVTEKSIANTFLRFQMSYEKLASFENPEPPPFAGEVERPPDTGVHLHWTLPKALRKGTHSEEQGSTEFPLVPNRWLIVRVQVGPAPVVKAWLLESDVPTPKGDGGSPYLDPVAAQSGIVKPVRIGRVRELQLADATNPQSLFLTAVAPGSVMFSAYSPSVKDVLSFRDSLDGIAEGNLVYSVAGWYSDPAKDPLANTKWVKDDKSGRFTNNTFDWFVAGSDVPPSRMLVHGSVDRVPWKRNGDNVPAPSYPTNIPKNVRVSFGNTAIDALAGMVAAQKGQPQADLLTAFQYGLLDEFDQPGSAERLNSAIRQNWFGATTGGTLWTIVPTEQQREGDEQQAPEPPTDEELAALAALNASQSRLDRETRILESMQWHLYGLWWKSGYLKKNWPEPLETPDDDDAVYKWFKDQLRLQVGEGSKAKDPGGADPTRESWYLFKVQAQQKRVDKFKAAAGLMQEALDLLLPSDPQRIGKKIRQRKAVNEPRYFHPNDPVVLITGLGRSTAFDPPRGVACRLLSQTIVELNVGGTLFSVIDGRGTDLRPAIPPLNDPNKVLPEDARRIYMESFFLLPSLLAAVTGKSLDDAIAAVKKLPEPSSEGPFAPLVYSREAWEQPWIPLLLDWDITIMKRPAYIEVKDEKTKRDKPYSVFQRDLWKFDGTDYVWQGPTESSADDFRTIKTNMRLDGRTFITPQLSFTLAQQLKEYVTQHQDRDPKMRELLEDLEKYIEEIEGQDMLSQRLSGLLAMMVQRQYSQTMSPAGEVGAAVEGARNGHPRPLGFKTASAVMDFAPMSGVFFVINRLAVIDTFGRMVNCTLANYSTSPQTKDAQPDLYFYPFTGRGLTPMKWKEQGPPTPISLRPDPTASRILPSASPTERMLQIPPRVIQDSQLSVRLVSNNLNNQDIRRVAGSNPVCGWIVPNHLDRSLALYSPEGSPWGEFFLSQRHRPERPTEPIYVPVWQPDPVNRAAPKQIADIPNVYVRRMLETLRRRSESDAGSAFRAFLRSIDETLWTINPRGQRQDQDLAVLVGRPLAIVRVELALKLRGLPNCNQDWMQTFAGPMDFNRLGNPAEIGREIGGIFDYSWPVRLGSPLLRDDGVVGFFRDDPNDEAKTFSVFNCISPAELATDYIKKIGEPGTLPMLRFTDDSVTVLDPKQNQVAYLTMLSDPRGAMHAFSGLLPVFSLEIPEEFVTPALRKISYMFRAGPYLMPSTGIRLPIPAETKGAWTWFDMLNGKSEVQAADSSAAFPAVPPVAREGWLNFQPDDGMRLNYEILPAEGPIRTSTRVDLSVKISNPRIGQASFERITIWIPCGDNLSSTLSSNAALPMPEVEGPSEWEVRTSTDTIVITPKGTASSAQVSRATPIVFQLKGISVNDQAGTVKISITERPFPQADASRSSRSLDKI